MPHFNVLNAFGELGGQYFDARRRSRGRLCGKILLFPPTAAKAQLIRPACAGYGLNSASGHTQETCTVHYERRRGGSRGHARHVDLQVSFRTLLHLWHGEHVLFPTCHVPGALL